MHNGQNLFGNLPHSCNLVSEFNGLVSKTGQQQCWPFYMPVIYPNFRRQRFAFPFSMYVPESVFPFLSLIYEQG